MNEEKYWRIGKSNEMGESLGKYMYKVARKRIEIQTGTVW